MPYSSLIKFLFTTFVIIRGKNFKKEETTNYTNRDTNKGDSKDSFVIIRAIRGKYSFLLFDHIRVVLSKKAEDTYA